MGKEVENLGYSKEEVAEFRKRLEEETELVRSWFESNAFVHDEQKTGIELEAWLINENMLPDPFNDVFLEELNNEQVVPEIAPGGRRRSHRDHARRGRSCRFGSC